MHYKYEPIIGYSVPVVRVSNDMGRVLFTLSFDVNGTFLGSSSHLIITEQTLHDAWEAWTRK